MSILRYSLILSLLFSGGAISAAMPEMAANEFSGTVNEAFDKEMMCSEPVMFYVPRNAQHKTVVNPVLGKKSPVLKETERLREVATLMRTQADIRCLKSKLDRDEKKEEEEKKKKPSSFIAAFAKEMKTTAIDAVAYGAKGFFFLFLLNILGKNVVKSTVKVSVGGLWGARNLAVWGMNSAAEGFAEEVPCYLGYGIAIPLRLAACLIDPFGVAN